MAAPGHKVILGERIASAFVAGGPGTAFFAGVAAKGSTIAGTHVVSLADAVTKLGERSAANPQLYDALDAYFHEGGSSAYVARVIGEEAVTASGNILDSESKKTLKAVALSPGTWANTITLDITLSGEELAMLVKLGGTTVESFAGMVGNEGLTAYVNANSQYVHIEPGSEVNKIAKTQAGVEVKGGKDELGKVTNKQLGIALETLGRDLGPGQLCAPGFLAEAEHKTMIAHAVANNRRALLDYPDTAEASATAALSMALRTASEHGARYAQGLAPWAVIPGLATGTYRTIPYSSIQAGMIARAEAEGHSPGEAVAGSLAEARYAVELSQHYTDAQRDTLNTGGVSAAILRKGRVKTYGNRTLVNPITEAPWKSFAASRLVMAVAGKADEVMDDYDFAEINKYVFSKLAGDLGARACMPYLDDFWGDQPSEGFQVNTGPDVNTPTSIAAEELKAQIAIRPTTSGEVLTTEVVKVPVTEAI